MKTAEILGANRFETFSKTRAGSRAVVVRDGMILLSRETKPVYQPLFCLRDHRHGADAPDGCGKTPRP